MNDLAQQPDRAPATRRDADRRIDTGNRLAMVYAGELYLNRDPFPFLEAVSRLLRLVHRILRAVLSGMNARATGGLSGDGGR